MLCDVDFHDKLVALASLPTEQNKVSEETGQPRIWYQRRPSEQMIFLDGTKGAHVNIPERSWLRMPVITKLPEAINAQSRAKWRDSILRDGVSATLKRLGILAEAVIQDAFATGGFGTWAKLSKVTIRRKKSAAILIASAQLRQSVTSRVVG